MHYIATKKICCTPPPSSVLKSEWLEGSFLSRSNARLETVLMVRFALLSAALAVGDAARIAKKRNASISIVNGEPADECEWKWQVGLGSGTTPWCGGMIISENWVLDFDI